MFADQVLRDFAEYLTLSGNRPDTVRTRLESLVMLAAWLPVPLLLATREQVYGWYKQYARNPSWTRITYGRSVRRFYRWALEQGRIAEDPTVGLPIPPTPRGRPRPVPIEDYLRALDAATGRMRMWLILAAGAGLRAGEIARLRREHVNDRARPPLLDVINGKGGHDRTVVIGQGVALAVAGWQVSRGPMWLVEPKTVSERVSEHFEGLGMQWTCHQLRHTYGSELYQSSGGDIRLVQDQMGHRSVNYTATYTAWDPKRATAAVDAYDSIVTPRTAQVGDTAA